MHFSIFSISIFLHDLLNTNLLNFLFFYKYNVHSTRDYLPGIIPIGPPGGPINGIGPPGMGPPMGIGP